MKAIYRFRGTLKAHEGVTEEGTIEATDESDARQTLTAQGYSDLHIKRIVGLMGLIKRVVRR